MSEQTTDKSLNQVQVLLQKGDKKAASILIYQILATDFENPKIWQYLYEMVGNDIPFETFKTQFIQKYYPEKAKSSARHSVENENLLPFTTDIQINPPSTKKCPYCAEDILFAAKVCRFCGRDLSQEHPDVIKSKRKTLNTTLATLEKNIADQESSLQEWQQVVQKESRGVTQSEIVFVIGILLTPIGIGIILIIISGLAYFSHKNNRYNAESKQTKIRSTIGALRKDILEAKNSLANLE